MIDLKTLMVACAAGCLSLTGCVAAPTTDTRASVTKLSSEEISEIKLEIAALVQHFEDTLNAKDPAQLGEGIHYPTYRLFNGKMQTIEAPSLEFAQQVLDYLASTGWDHTRYGALNFVHVSNTKVHVDTPFTRYRADGSEIGTWRSIYIFTREDGQWGLKFRSSFANLDK